MNCEGLGSGKNRSAKPPPHSSSNLIPCLLVWVNASLIPSWAKDAKISRHTYNARSETVAEKPSYRTAWRKRQFCLVLADNFYEPNYGTGKAVRWGIQTEDSNPFGIAGLWDKWTEPATGEVVVSFSMLTVNADAHPVMCQFHKTGDEKRTPVIIQPED